MLRPHHLLPLLVLLLPLAAIHAEALEEAYGHGPPYYGRTTNMDKWSSPLPFLGAIDAVVLVLGIGLVGLARRG